MYKNISTIGMSALLLLLSGILYPVISASADVTRSITPPFDYTFDSPAVVSQSSTLDRSASPYFWVKSGSSLAIANGVAKTPTSSNYNELFMRTLWQDISESVYTKILSEHLARYANRNPWNGILQYVRYQNDSNYYYAGVRDDGNAVIAKKLNGTYKVIASSKFFPGTYSKDTHPTLLPQNTWIGLRTNVTTGVNGAAIITLFVDEGRTGNWTKAVSVTDTDNPITAKGLLGIRTDYMNVLYDDFDVDPVLALSPSPLVIPAPAPAPTPIPAPATLTTPTPTPTAVSAPAIHSFSVVETNVNPATPLLNQPLTITATLKNTGSADANLITEIELFDPQGTRVTHAVFDSQSLGANESKRYPLSWTPSASGTYTVKVGVFSANWASNYLWNDNALSFVVNTVTTPTPNPTPTPAPTAEASGVLFSDDFNSYANGVITSEGNYWSQTGPSSDKWEMTSGTLYAADGQGWSGIPDTTNNSGVFRLNTKRFDFQNVRVSMDLTINNLTTTAVTPATDWDGVHIFLRYQSEYYLYYASISRRDGAVVIKKKVPGGPSNGGTYYNISTYNTAPLPLNQKVHVAATVQNQADGSVKIQLFSNGALVATAIDQGTGGAPITNAGATGIRGDNANFFFDNFTVEQL